MTEIEPPEIPSTYEDDHMLALWFTPMAVQEHFEGDFDDDMDETTAWLAKADVEQLKAVGKAALCDDRLYKAFHEALYEAATDVMETPAEYIDPTTGKAL